MLQYLRKYADNLLFKLLLGFLIVSFVIAGISGILSSSSKDYVAVDYNLLDKVAMNKDILNNWRAIDV